MKKEKVVVDRDDVKKDRPWTGIHCKFCICFRDARMNHDRIKGYYCEPADRWILDDTPACRHFDLGQVFYCSEFNQVIFLENCLHRQTKECTFGEYHDACKKCKSGKLLNHMINGLNIRYNIIGGDNEE